MPLAIGLVAALTCLGLVLRLRTLNHSVYGDEFATLDATWHQDLAGVLRAVRGPQSSEANPPLFFILAWASLKLGDPTVWVRLPSLVFGVLAVPFVYLLGLATVGRRAALVGVALIALSPFAIYYSTEARAYGTLTFFSAASTLALLKALGSRRAAWWACYVLCADAIVYTHYSGIFVIGAQAAWAFWIHRKRWRLLLIVYLVAAAGFFPWWQSFQGQTGRVGLLDQYAHTSGQTPLRALVTWLDGTPLSALSHVPGVPALVLLGLGVTAGLLGQSVWAWRRRRTGQKGARWPSEVCLVTLLAVVTPAGLGLYDAASGHALLAVPRNLSASLPCAVLSVGWLVTPPGRVSRGVATVLTLAAVGLGAILTLDPSTDRPPFRAAIQFINSHARPGDRLGLATKSYSLGLTFGASRSLYLTQRVSSIDPDSSGEWIGPEHRFFVVTFGCHPCTGEGHVAVDVGTSWRRVIPRAYHLVSERAFPGVVRIVVDEYVGARRLVSAVKIRSVAPASGAIGVPVTTSVSADFDHSMDYGSATAFSLKRSSDGSSVVGRLAFLGDEMLLFKPRSALASGTRYTATVSTEASDVDGNRLASPRTWSFTTAAPSAACPPAVQASTSEPTSKRLRIAPGRVGGSIDAAQIVGNLAEICGWAADVKDHRIADAVLVFADGKFVGAVRPNVRRPDVARAVGGLGENSGFSVKLPLSEVERGRKTVNVQLFAIERGVASQLALDCRRKPHDFGC